MATTFDFETALKQLQSGQALTGENGILTPLIKRKRPLNPMPIF
ncbi:MULTISPECIES: hypothetical protein [Acinetobacter]|nr:MULTISPECIES: hypothetical protein [Acinetobacter]WOE27717.1 hypothetical protein QSG83_09750 [Acinetobacter towneri]